MGPKEIKCLRLAGQQWGVLERAQALDLGFSRQQIERRVNDGAWQPVVPGIYRVEGSPKSWHQQLKAVSLWASEGFALSHRTAAVLLKFRRFTEGPVEVTATRRLRAHPGVIAHFTPALAPRELTSIEGLRVTSATRTLLDLAATETEHDLRATVDEALCRRQTTLERLDAALDKVPHQRGMPILRRIVNELAGGAGITESELEARVLELLERAGLPRPRRQATVRIGKRLRRLDFHFTGTPVIIEADGYAYHASAAAFESDRRRLNSLVVRGFRVLRWTWSALHERPEELLAELRLALATCV